MGFNVPHTDQSNVVGALDAVKLGHTYKLNWYLLFCGFM